MSSSLQKLGSRIFIYLVSFVVIFALIMAFVFGGQMKNLVNKTNQAFYEVDGEIATVTRDTYNEEYNVFLTDILNMEVDSVKYVMEEIEKDLNLYSEILVNHYYEFEGRNNNYTFNPKDLDERIKIFYDEDVDRDSKDVNNTLVMMSELNNELLLSLVNDNHTSSFYIFTNVGVGVIASQFDYRLSETYKKDVVSFRNEDWYKNLVSSGEFIIEDVYTDNLTGKKVFSIEKAIYTDDKVFGVIVQDIYIDALTKINLGLNAPSGVNCFISNSKGELVYNAKESLYDEKKGSEGTVYQFLDSIKNEEDSGRGAYTYGGNDYRVFYKKVKGTPFIMCVSIREGRVEEKNENLHNLIEEKNDYLLTIINGISTQTVLFIIIFLAFLTFVIFAIARRLSKVMAKPIDELSNVLNAASKIQRDMLPDDFNNISNRKDIEIYAKNIPEAEIGGDFYNYIIKNNKLFLIIADVSGSGIPAALFMAKTNELLNSAIKFSNSPEVILSYVNIELCKNNKENYFVTIALYCIDLLSREVIYANAGHEDSIIIKGSGEIIKNDESRVGPLGLDELNNCREGKFTLDVNDKLFLYTDGVVEAINKDKKFYGIDRLVDKLKNINEDKNISAKGTVSEVLDDVMDFSKGTEQYDDITVLCIKFNEQKFDGNEFVSEMEFPVEYESISKVDEFIKKSLDSAYENDANKYQNYINQINVCIDEIVVNICDYAYKEKNDNNKFTIKISIDKNTDLLSLSFIDSGVPFDPTKREETNILEGLDERNVGGLGIHITRSFADLLEYKYENNQNILTIKKYL